MNNQQAIDLLKGLEQSLDDYCELNDEGKTAFRMAITALELFGNSEQLPSIQPDTTTHDSNVVKKGGNNEDRTSGDCISRQVAIDALLGITAMRNTIPLDSAIFNIKKLPSAQPERKTGRWLPDNTDYYRTKFICSVCGESEEVPTTGFGYGTMWDYCPMCGAKMERRQDGH